MNIVYSSSDAYCACTCTSLFSLLTNNKDVGSLDVYVLSTDISEKNKKRIIEIGQVFGRRITIIDALDDFIQGAKDYDLELLRGAYNTYSRIMLNKWFSNLDKVIVIDSDTLVLGNISPMWGIDLDGKLIAAVPEIGVYSQYSTIESSDIIDKVDCYFNMGIIVVNLKEWRESKIDSVILESIKKQKEPNLVADQSIINRYINDRIVKMDLKFNFYSPMHGTSCKTIGRVFNKKKVFSDEEIVKAQKEPVIIHFYGHPYERPWFKHSCSIFKKEYLAYRKQTAWGSEKLSKWKKSPSLVFKVYDLICFFLLKFHLVNTCLKFRYITGQKLKAKLKTHR